MANGLSIITQTREIPLQGVAYNWAGSALKNEHTLHQLSPYVGKIKSSMAATLVEKFSHEGDIVLDPFSGSGTVALESWVAGRRIIATDLSPYAHLLTRAKLFPCKSLEEALGQINRIDKIIASTQQVVDLRKVPPYVRQFYHPDTLREIIVWVEILKKRGYWFLLASLMGILHHQRPGFLSFPSSHTVPYLRTKKFPRNKFPELYEYRSLRNRLEAKVTRAFKRMPMLDFNIERACFLRDATKFELKSSVDVIITSPPYMRLLDYGRDNRLRLWFLGEPDWATLDERVSPRKDQFLALMKKCFVKWKTILKPGNYCVLIVGDAFSQISGGKLPELVSKIATEEVGCFKRVFEYSENIPNERRVRRGIGGSTSETIMVFRNTSSIHETNLRKA